MGFLKYLAVFNNEYEFIYQEISHPIPPNFHTRRIVRLLHLKIYLIALSTAIRK